MSSYIKQAALRSARVVRPKVDIALLQRTTPCLHVHKMSLKRSLNVSAGSDISTVNAAVDGMRAGGKWQVTNKDSAIERYYSFKTFKAAWVG